MVEDGFRDDGRVRRIRQKGIHDIFYGRKLCDEFRSGLCIAIQPFFNVLNLLGEMKCGGPESR